jgi:hypothetical protein
MAMLYWRIEGFKKLETVFKKDVPVGSFTNDQIRQVLRALAAKGGLSNAEIVGAYAKRRTRIANDLLEVHRDGPKPQYWCGSDPVFTARVVDESGKRARFGPDIGQVHQWASVPRNDRLAAGVSAGRAKSKLKQA